jgi:hypothetical protein
MCLVDCLIVMLNDWLHEAEMFSLLCYEYIADIGGNLDNGNLQSVIHLKVLIDFSKQLTLHIYRFYYMWEQIRSRSLAHPCHLIWIYPSHFFVTNNPKNLNNELCRSWSDIRNVPSNLDLHCSAMDNSHIRRSKELIHSQQSPCAYNKTNFLSTSAHITDCKDKIYMKACLF